MQLNWAQFQRAFQLTALLATLLLSISSSHSGADTASGSDNARLDDSNDTSTNTHALTTALSGSSSTSAASSSAFITLTHTSSSAYPTVSTGESSLTPADNTLSTRDTQETSAITQQETSLAQLTDTSAVTSQAFPGTTASSTLFTGETGSSPTSSAVGAFSSTTGGEPESSSVVSSTARSTSRELTSTPTAVTAERPGTCYVCSTTDPGSLCIWSPNMPENIKPCSAKYCTIVSRMRKLSFSETLTGVNPLEQFERGCADEVSPWNACIFHWDDTQVCTTACTGELCNSGYYIPDMGDASILKPPDMMFCYSCESTDANSHCVLNPQHSSVSSVRCPYKYCYVKRVEHGGLLHSFSRGCADTIAPFETCETVGSQKSCASVCTSNLCNSMDGTPTHLQPGTLWTPSPGSGATHTGHKSSLVILLISAVVTTALSI